MKYNFSVWQKITSDRVILDIIKNGLKINFKGRPGITSAPKIPHSEQEIKIINKEIKKLLNKGVIIECERDKSGFISTIFTRQKKDGSFRTILNLKHLNHYVNYQHFKMESLNDVFKIIKRGVWMASVDLKDAFFTVPVHKLHQKFFMFEWIQKFYKFVGMPNGYSDAMRIFTKILKPVFGHLRQEGHLSVIFVDDSYLQGDTKQECMNNIKATVDLLLKLGFIVHEKKSVLKPTQKIEFLGFIIDSNSMTIEINREKAEHILLKIRKFLQNPSPIIRKLASVVGSVISIFPAKSLGKLHYPALEKEKISLLKEKCGNYEAKILSLNKHAIEDLKWWLGATPNAKNNINTPQADFEINTVASGSGWGATDGSNPT